MGNTRIAIPESEAPTTLVQTSFGGLMQTSSYVYQEPSWWSQSPAASVDLTANLNDGSKVIYRWYKFVDQPALQRFDMNQSEKNGIQSAIEKMQKEWAHFPMMTDPTSGSLVSFDSGLLVTPPKGMEIGYVPIVVKQMAADQSAVDKALASIITAGKNAGSAIAKAAAEKAAAELKAKQDAEAKAAADKAAADLKLKQEADAKVAAEKAAADIKAKQDAEAKAAADKVAASKKITITCIKGKLTKKVTSLKPVCPAGYKKKP